MAKITWKTKEEIEHEASHPSETDLLREETQMVAMALMDLTELIMGGID